MPKEVLASLRGQVVMKPSHRRYFDTCVEPSGGFPAWHRESSWGKIHNAVFARGRGGRNVSGNEMAVAKKRKKKAMSVWTTAGKEKGLIARFQGHVRTSSAGKHKISHGKAVESFCRRR